MFNRSLLLVLAILVFSFTELVLRGCHAAAVVGQNLPDPRNPTGLRIVDLVHPTAAFARMYDLTFEPGRKGFPSPAGGARLQIQLSSNGKTRLLVVRSGHPAPSWRNALSDLAFGRARLLVVADRGWVDLGPVPAGASLLEAQLIGLLPAPYGFAELNQPADPLFERITIRQPAAPEVRVVTTVPRYRVVTPSPVAPGETLARFFLFILASPVLLFTGLAALLLLVPGWRFLSTGRAARAVCCLVPAAALLHAVCLPPLQGADETSHMATVERLVFGQIPPKLGEYPRSISLLAEALDQDRVQFHPDEPLPAQSPGDRSRLRGILRKSLASEATQNGLAPAGAGVLAIDLRSPLFFRPFRLLAPLLRKLSILDRVSSYRLLATASGLLLFCGGAWFLHRARLSEQSILLYGLVFLVPYMVAATASCSNYAPAVGLGSLLAAAALTAILVPSGRGKSVAAALLVSGSWIGIPIWPDFVFVAMASTAIVLAWLIDRAICAWTGKARSVLRWIAGGALAALLLAVAVGLSRLKVGNIGTRRLPLEFPRWESPEATLMILVAAAPFLLAVGAALAVLRIGRKTLPEVRLALRRVSIGLAILSAAGFLLTPYTAVPFETLRLNFARLVGAHNLSFWSNNFSWDQDRLFWKFYWGSFGWHDSFYPDWLYALARWACVGLFLALPVLSARFVAGRPRTSAFLILVSGIAVSFCFATETLRYLEPANPWGRFLLPFLPLAALPILVQTEAPARERALRLGVAVGAGLHVWTALVVLGSRYTVGS